MSNQSEFGGTGNSNALINSGTNGEQALASGDAGATPPTKQTTSTPWYLSRTLWINVAALLSLLVPAVRDWLTANPVEFTSALGAINVLLRFVTVGKYQLAEPTDDQDGGADESAPRASHTSGAGGSALLLMIGMSLVMMTWACSGTDKQTAASVALTDGQVVVIRGGSSLVVDRDNHSVSWTQSTPDVVVVPPVVQATGK
ncbi:hypothetical protein CXU13_05140 [Akkermansia muciniphila]|nr:hypothetical protein CXU12_00585 [Akkermansia muciniphila]PNC60095.1 hypothetical protein CXU13_05140 [Akkermansia muciniphila]